MKSSFMTGKKVFYSGVCVFLAVLIVACNGREEVVQKNAGEFKVWAWMGCSVKMKDYKLKRYFKKASEVGIDAIFILCHGGRPAILDNNSFRDSAALVILRKAAGYAERYGIELHAWMWTTNRGERTLCEAHPEWYQVNGLGQNINDIKLYDSDLYHFICPSHEGVLEYMKERVREMAEISDLRGIHMDFIRYPDVILPYGLQSNYDIVQDKVYPLWDFCYCSQCREQFKALTGKDPFDLENPWENEDWLRFRLNSMTDFAGEIAKEIKSCGKISSAAVFATPNESRKLVRQDWTNFRNVDYLMPMIYDDLFDKPVDWVNDAMTEGMEELKNKCNTGKMIPGVYIKKNIDEETLNKYFEYAYNNGTEGICLFNIQTIDSGDSWDILKRVIFSYKNLPVRNMNSSQSCQVDSVSVL